jgi:2-hydroxychromene-2-carboxylate isomerase
MARGECVDAVLYGDYDCPLSFLAEAVLAPLEAAHGLRVERRGFELRPAPAPLPESGGGDAYWLDHIVPYAQALGSAIRRPPAPVRTRKAHEAALHAAQHDRFDAFHRALLLARFVDARDIGRIDVLVAIGDAAGLDRTALKVALDIDQHAAQVDAARDEALGRGITGTPALLRAGAEPELMLGLREPDEIRAWLLRGRFHD